MAVIDCNWFTFIYWNNLFIPTHLDQEMTSFLGGLCSHVFSIYAIVGKIDMKLKLQLLGALVQKL